ncbi:hypothetical protein Sgly_1877 [Syntrophobotulus glycolicus DSM 8271]|uniref:EamA domain-containing protein n=1 Tax=Syntrophobotulus glycolicus (strain DSM 8271 / FlGlyR) TaxID=645991 RepID=F0T087_SYNGF|nr:membrane protein [Syntrophobotulus glycolicus]ADY56174.1 hypothetical protein Sgly_1877 [Syntrophobotulus glycolicus DSM 8271]
MKFLLILLNIILLVSGQTLWKLGLRSEEITFSLQSIVKCFFNPYIISGLVLYVIATGIWLYLLSKMEFSLLYPLQSLCYVGGALVAFFIFKEHLPATRMVGIFVILIGAYLVSLK